MSLKDCIAHDISAVFLNVNEFCDNLIIQSGTERISIIGSMQQNTVQNNSGNGNALQAISWTLYTKYPINNKIFTPNARITVDDVSYTVVDISNELGIATIHLKTAQGR